MYRTFGKRALDLVLGATASLVLLPLFVAIGIAVAVLMGRPVIFRQLRTGRHGHTFTIYKFRTMTDARDVSGNLKSDAARLTWLGTMLRATSLDELPQLWNVFRGDASLVGPRPLLPEYWDYYTDEQRRRHMVRPGITGLAQINGRQFLPFSNRFELDTWYVDHLSLWVDLKIIAATVIAVFGGQDIQDAQDARDVDDVGISPFTRQQRSVARGGNDDDLTGTNNAKAT